MTADTATDRRPKRPLPALIVAFVVSLIVGLVVLTIVNAGLALIWDKIPGAWTSTPAWYVIAVMVVAGVLVYLVRTFVGDHGHSPLDGLGIHPLTPKEYVGAILAIVATLWGGIVLGPEVALISTGTMIGGVMARAFKINDAKATKNLLSVGALGAILALLVAPILAGTAMLDQTPKTIEYSQLWWAIVVAAIATVAVTIARIVGAGFAHLAGGKPHLIALVVSALIIAASALVMQYITGENVLFVATSGEEMISDLPAITSASTVAAILLFKTIAYGASLGSGYRGGPFFPAMFVGAATGLLIALLLPGVVSVQAAIVVGVVASLIATAKMSWKVAIVLGIIVGAVMGSWTLIPAAVVAAIVARLIPRWGDKVTQRYASAAMA